MVTKLSTPIQQTRRRAPTKALQRAESVENMLDAARTLFVENGYRGTTLELIANTAGLTKGAVYFYFRSKEAMLLELLKAAEAIAINPAIEKLKASSPSPVERLVQFFHSQSQLSVANGSQILLLILMSLEFKGANTDAAKYLYEILERLYSQLEQTVLEGQRANAIRNDVSARELSAVLMALHDGTFLEWYKRDATLRGPELTRAVRIVVLGGLVAESM